MKDKDPTGETRVQIMDAAMEHFAEYGYRGASVSKIAEKAGVSKSLIFWYFNNKEALFKSLLDHFVQKCADDLELNGPTGNARMSIENLIDSYWAFIKKNFKFVRIFMNWFMQLTPSNKLKRQTLRNLHYKFQEIMESYLNQGIREGIFKSDMDVRSTALGIVSCLEGIVLQIVIDDMNLHDLKEEFFQSLKKNLFHGIQKESQ